MLTINYLILTPAIIPLSVVSNDLVNETTEVRKAITAKLSIILQSSVYIFPAPIISMDTVSIAINKPDTNALFTSNQLIVKTFDILFE